MLLIPFLGYFYICQCSIVQQAPKCVSYTVWCRCVVWLTGLGTSAMVCLDQLLRVLSPPPKWLVRFSLLAWRKRLFGNKSRKVPPWLCRVPGKAEQMPMMLLTFPTIILTLVACKVKTGFVLTLGSNLPFLWTFTLENLSCKFFLCFWDTWKHFIK